MMNFFKKKISNNELSVLMIKTVSDELQYIIDTATKYFENESNNELKNRAIEESQWAALACGLVLVCLDSNKTGAVREIILSIINNYSKIATFNNKPSTDKQLEHIYHSILTISQEFIRGTIDAPKKHDSFDYGFIYMCDALALQISNEHQEPNSLINQYTAKIINHFMSVFINVTENYKLL